jgi:hypothetical protein
MGTQIELFGVKYKEGSLDPRAAELIKFAVNLAIGHEHGAKLHVDRARQQDASEDIVEYTETFSNVDFSRDEQSQLGCTAVRSDGQVEPGRLLRTCAIEQTLTPARSARQKPELLAKLGRPSMIHSANESFTSGTCDALVNLQLDSWPVLASIRHTVDGQA